MSETKWTPGPWEITSGFIGPLKIVANVDQSIDRSGKMEVAHVGAETFDRCRANARLISAAPDMAEALQAAIDCGMVPISSAKEGGASRHSRQVEVADMIRSALAKARGEA